MTPEQELAKLKDLLRRMFQADEASGCGFYNDEDWCAAYMQVSNLINFMWADR